GLEVETARSDRIDDGLRERGEKLRSPRGHVPAILQAHPEFSGNVDAGLVGEAHAELERGRVSVNEISGLVAVEADAVAGAVRKPGELIARPPALALVIRAHRVVELAGRDSYLRRLES